MPHASSAEQKVKHTEVGKQIERRMNWIESVTDTSPN